MLSLTRIKRQSDLRLYCFEEYSRPDYLARAIHLGVDARFCIRSLRLNSAAFGVVAFSYGRGLTESSGWEDEAEARVHSGTAKYYAVAGITHSPAVLDKVLNDTLRAAPDDAFRTMVREFIAETNKDVFYNFTAYQLEPIRTTGQIHILRYLKPDKKRQDIPLDLTGLADAVYRNLNPVYVARESYGSVVGSLKRIQYTCTHCGEQNALLSSHCTACLSPRPPLRLHALFIFLLRAFIDMSYAVYAILAIAFLIFTLFHLPPGR